MSRKLRIVIRMGAFFRQRSFCRGLSRRIPRQLLLVAALFMMIPVLYAEVRYYSLADVEVLAVHEHNTSSFTEGYFFDGDVLCESGGYWFESAFYENNVCMFTMDRSVFAEGSVMLDGKLFMLTYQNKIAYIYDAETFKLKTIVQYPREGWGLTSDGKKLIASDGSSRLYFMDTNYRVKKTLSVTEKGKPVSKINELEYIDGYIWANVFLTDDVVVIDAATGEVCARIDFSELYLKKERNKKADVMNGLAWNADTKKLWMTGKYWDKAFEVDVSVIMDNLGK
ncbi:MAG: glutaminyl-peptide cyclotransferase [Treponemataceae bacterium]|nr:glutaminyl-peptide cyclotransferase [Treponemataceae bacterium]